MWEIYFAADCDGPAFKWQTKNSQSISREATDEQKVLFYQIITRVYDEIHIIDIYSSIFLKRNILNIPFNYRNSKFTFSS